MLDENLRMIPHQKEMLCPLETVLAFIRVGYKASGLNINMITNLETKRGLRWSLQSKEKTYLKSRTTSLVVQRLGIRRVH
jgi:hypothetical protein